MAANVITLKSKQADKLREVGDEAAALLSAELGVRVTRHAALLVALRRGLADILGRTLVLHDDS